MWQAPSQRIKAIAEAKRRAKDRLGKPIHLKRVRAELQTLGHGLGEQATTTPARLILNDITVKGLSLFSTVPFEVGQHLALTLEEPRRFYAKVKVTSSQNQGSESHVIHQEKLNYRIGLKFVVKNDEEKAEIEKYIAELCAEYLYKSEAA